MVGSYFVELEPSSWHFCLENKFGIFNAARLNRSMASSKYCDINNYEDLSEAIKKMNPSFIFHLAAEPLVGRSIKIRFGI